MRAGMVPPTMTRLSTELSAAPGAIIIAITTSA
jgi:hypothetical protein